MRRITLFILMISIMVACDKTGQEDDYSGGSNNAGEEEISGTETSGTETSGTETGGTENGGAETGGTETSGTESAGAETSGAESAGAEINAGELNGGESTGSISDVMLDAVPCDSDEVDLPLGWATALLEAGLTKCVMPFGIIIGAAPEVPDSYIGLAARIVAEIVDPDQDGVANDERVLSFMAYGALVWLPMPADYQSWVGGVEESLGRALNSYGIMIPEWWIGGFEAPQPNERARAVMVEEIIHAFTQFGYASAYPSAFGVNDWSSVIAQETQRAQCDWWQHPENSCPGQPSVGGDCSYPSCDVTEFYQQVVVLRAGMTPAWFGDRFPRTLEELEARLSPEIKAVIDDPTHHQIRSPFTFTYGQ